MVRIIRYFLPVALLACGQPTVDEPREPQEEAVFSKDILLDKIKGGWAGQVIGVTFGGPTEFRYQGTMINDYQPIAWYDGYIRQTMTDEPGLYDDIYMDLTFVDVFEREGLDAPIESHANAYANAEYVLWHANQAGRYNVRNNIAAPESGHWLNNPHADDIDFQIESDFAGLMSPGMPNAASTISDGIGHIMNYGDGWYGGVFVGAMYSLAFVSDDVEYIVKEALKTIPERATFYQCIRDVVQWYEQYPDDWKQNWFEIQRKWSDDVGCPDGVFHAFNIDAKLNAAYIVLGLLYGGGDFEKTMEISTRAGQDSDCNPSSAGGILGTMMGYNNIPEYWKMGLEEAEDIDFKYTTMSLNDVYDMGFRQALQVIERNNGSVNGDSVTIRIQQPKEVRFEQSFEGHYPVEKRGIHEQLENEYSFEFEGIGFVLMGEAEPKEGSSWDYTGDGFVKAELHIDGEKVEEAKLPANYRTRRLELFWKYQLERKKHNVTVKLINPDPAFEVNMSSLLIYDSKPITQR